jgi:DNA-binding winged helix-turn-helix (wHTH) protein/Tol biopolymer transport system component
VLNSSGSPFESGMISDRAQFSRTVSFAEFELDLDTAELRSNGNKTIVPGQPFHILCRLLERPGQLVSREELKKQLWPSATFVDFDVSLNKAVNRLRLALRDSAESPRFIETLPRKGYRFIGAVGNGVDIATGSAAVSDHLPYVDTSAQEDRGEAAQRDRARSHALRYAPAVLMACLIAAVIVICISFLRHGTGVPDFRNVQITKLTDSGGATYVAISPDSHYVVYSLRHGEDEELRLRHISTRSDVEILADGPGFHGLTFSPGGDYIFFVRSDPNDPYFKFLYSVPVLGGPVRKLIADVDSPVTFSPNGRQFAFERAACRRNVIELRIANADGSDEHVIATIQNGDAGLFQPGPSWSPDGRVIICPFRILAKEMRWILASVSVPDGAVRELYSDTTEFGRPIWLSGRNLLVPRYDPAYERWQLWTIAFPRGTPRRFTNDLTEYGEPLDISRDGKMVTAMASTVGSNVWETQPDNPSTARQVTFGQLPIMSVVETSNGRIISSGGDGRVWIIKRDGQREVFGNFHNVGWLRACDDSILFTSFQANAVTLNRAVADNPRSMKLFSGDLSYPGCSPDGKFAYYVNGHRPQKLWRISTEGGSPEEIADGMGEGVTSSLDVSPDGTLLSYAFDQYRPTGWKLAVISVRGGSTIYTFEVPGGTSNVRWSPTGAGLQYVATQAGASNVWEQALTGGKPKQLTNFTSGRIFDFNWSRDHRRLLITHGDVTSDVVLLSGFR